jgi:oligoendopeptidase F
MLASHHSTFTFHSSLPLAETASTFGEIMLTEKLLARETDEAVRRDILFKQMDDAFATVLRQIYFAMFERQAHEMIQKNASTDELSEAYLENLKEQFGDSVEVSDEFKWEWVSIPHIYHVPFYVYAYAFGQLLVFSLYQQYRAEASPSSRSISRSSRRAGRRRRRRSWPMPASTSARRSSGRAASMCSAGWWMSWRSCRGRQIHR